MHTSYTLALYIAMCSHVPTQRQEAHEADTASYQSDKPDPREVLEDCMWSLERRGWDTQA